MTAQAMWTKGRRLLSPPRRAHYPAVGPAAKDWEQALRAELLSRGKPPEVRHQLVCQRGHQLLWLVTSPWGLVPISRPAAKKRNIELRGLGDAVMTLEQWPEGERLPWASCQCHEQVELTPEFARERVRSRRRDKWVYRP